MPKTLQIGEEVDEYEFENMRPYGSIQNSKVPLYLFSDNVHKTNIYKKRELCVAYNPLDLTCVAMGVLATQARIFLLYELLLCMQRVSELMNQIDKKCSKITISQHELLHVLRKCPLVRLIESRLSVDMYQVSLVVQL